jgi:cell division protein FtsI/penicillin-binding protein 2
MQLAAAFCTIANGGYLVKPTLVRNVTHKLTADGEVWTEPQPEGEDANKEPYIISDNPRDDSLLLASYANEGSDVGRMRVLSEESSRIAREWLSSCVEGGTGKRAKLARFNAAGKTGTGQIAGNGGYQKGAYTSSFVGFFPVEKPSYVVLVMVMHPRGGKYYGGEVAAPVFKAVGDRISFLDQLKPHEGQYAN